MNKYTLEYYLEQDRLKKEKRREKYLLNHPNSKERKRVELDEIEKLAKENKSNKEISMLCGISVMTVCMKKKKLRDMGISLPFLTSKGRPKKYTYSQCPTCGQTIKYIA